MRAWPTSSSSTGSGCVFPTECGPSSSPGCSRFEGIAVSHRQNSVLDGNGDSICWYHAIGASSDCKGGLPGRNSQIAYSMKFFIRTTETPTPKPTPPPPPNAGAIAGTNVPRQCGGLLHLRPHRQTDWGYIFRFRGQAHVLDERGRYVLIDYMKLGNLVSSPEAFMDNGKCRFSLIYDDPMILERKQTSWPTVS